VRHALRIQLWSYNYEPEPTGIAPVSASWAREMASRGHDVRVVAAHPHYPEPRWGTRLRPYRERRDGVSVVRLPIWIGRKSGAQRIRQEVSYAAALAAAAPILGPADAIVAVSPNFPALLPAMVASRAKRVPLVIWLQDILPEGASTTGLVENKTVLAAAQRFEHAAYRSAARIIVPSDAFARNLEAKGVPPAKLARIYNPARVLSSASSTAMNGHRPHRLVVIGNIGHSQGLAQVVGALETSGALERHDAQLRITGHGVARDAVAAEIRTERVELLGLLPEDELREELESAVAGVVTQRSDVTEFNIPSKLMTYMGNGLPVLAVVRPGSETARLVEGSGGGWVVDSSRLDLLGDTIADLLNDPDDRQRRAKRAHAFASREFDIGSIAERSERLLLELPRR
jgi:colanic acid biosynthesis glycosyl transferase WcaI